MSDKNQKNLPSGKDNEGEKLAGKLDDSSKKELSKEAEKIPQKASSPSKPAEIPKIAPSQGIQKPPVSTPQRSAIEPPKSVPLKENIPTILPDKITIRKTKNEIKHNFIPKLDHSKLGYSQHAIARIYVAILMIELFFIIFGGVWAIIDQFTTHQIEDFKILPFQAQLFTIGLIAFGFFIVILFLSLLYSFGRNLVLRAFYGKSPLPAEYKLYKLPKIFSWGEELSILLIIIGIMFSIVEIIITQNSTLIAVDHNYSTLTYGEQAVFWGIIIFVFSLFLLIGIFLLQNGYNFLMGMIIRANQRLSIEYSLIDRHKKINMVFYGLIIVSLAVIAFGIMWTILDLIYPGTAWDAFVTYQFGYKIVIIGAVATAEFAILLGFMMISKWMQFQIAIALFMNVVPSKEAHPNIFTKITVTGLLTAIFLMIFSGILSLLALMVSELPQGNILYLLIAIDLLPFGTILMSYGAILLTFIVLILLGIFLFNNGFRLIAGRITETQLKLDEQMVSIVEHKKTGH